MVLRMTSDLDSQHIRLPKDDKLLMTFQHSDFHLDRLISSQQLIASVLLLLKFTSVLPSDTCVCVCIFGIRPHGS